MFTDLRYVLRSLARAKSFTAVVVLTLAIGIGSAAAIFSVVDWVLFRSVNFPADLVWLGLKSKRTAFAPSTYAPQADAYRTMTAIFSETAFAKNETLNVVVDGEPMASSVARVSANFLSVIGAVPVQGRGFLPDEGSDGRSAVVVITDDFRREAFPDGGEVTGRQITIDQTICTIVGVLAPRQILPLFVQGHVLRPFALRPDARSAWQEWLFMFARLRRGVTPAQAEQVMLSAKLEPAPPQMTAYLGDQVPRVASMREAYSVINQNSYWVQLGAVGFLYAIACLNATNLMLVRILGRRRELSIRLALGASRARLVRLLAIESLALALGAGAIGVLVANWLLPILLTLAGSQSFDWSRWSLDWRSVAILIALTITTALLIVIVPGFRITRANVQEGLKQGGSALGETRGLARMRSGFVILQAAFALILLTGAGLMVRSFDKIRAVPLGFETQQRMKMQLRFPQDHVAGNADRHELLKRLQSHLKHVPGVLAVSYGTDSLLSGYYYGAVTVNLPSGDTIGAKVDNLSANFLETSGMVLKRGRMIAETGGEIMINEALARKRFGDQEPIGQMIHKTKDSGSGEADWLVVGVVGDVRHRVREDPGYRIYAPETWWSPLIDTFILRVSREPDPLMEAALKRAGYEFDRKIVVNQIAGFEKIRDWFGDERFRTSILKVLSGLALTLATVGMFAVLAYTVDRRMGEFGVRLALGATSRDLIGLVVRRGVILALAGIAAGTAGSLALVRYLQSSLYQTPPHDPVVLASVALLLLGSAVLASVLPARRATTADVAKLLRSE